ncbi:type II toxin-antitoxin system RelE/ParE family toxin [Asticcacaulis sp.]|uniref:type II toxin-antitoxin system RelE family toxin n=1 Tax=Asticcacaulis sp. TaxID=1872648 RepID=UPI00262AD97B|nr:type II toxin-antitoxin system RelE/ParE family toxin [Asticcacaulis sp.]
MKAIIYEPAAERALERINARDRARIEDRLETYALTGHGDIKAMKGLPLLRLRVGDYRVLFTEDLQVLDVIDLGHRRDIYQ